MKLKLQFLGSFAVYYDGQSLDSFRSNKARALLVYLATDAASGNERAAREHLMTLLWPRTPQKSAQVNLRQTLYQLRKAIPEVAGPDGERVPFLLSDRTQVQINPDAHYELDIARFLRLLPGESSPEELAEAVDLYRDPFLSDFHLPDSESFEEWAAGRRAALERMALEALERLAEHHLAQGESEEAERYARRQVALDELRESGHRQLLRALAQKGERNKALAHYEDYCELLQEELGVAPSAEIAAVYETIREGEGGTVGVARPESAMSREAEPGRKRRLPEPSTTFIDRQELAAVTAQLIDGCRLLTLVGPGGSGKTRMGIEVARELESRHSHGAAFVELAPLSDAAAIPTAIATALDFRFSGGASPREQVLNYLANKELLLMLDNFEHLLDGAGLVAELLEAAPRVSVIATSRARLNLGSECLFEVGGLSLPGEGGGFEEAEAVQLFLEHAGRVRPGFKTEKADKAAVAHICHLVEGMPLALELAASWVRYLPPDEIARELAEDVDLLESERADLPERQRSMRAAFNYSWNLLDEHGRNALLKLSVFRGGASRRAARAVTGASLRALVALADHSLLILDPDSGRFAVHELIRQFAMERLEEAGEAEALRDAHGEYYLQALAARLPELKGRAQLEALDAIERDFENVGAAWRWAIQRGEWEHFSGASQTLFLFALFRNRYQDSIELLELARDALISPDGREGQLAGVYICAAWGGLLSWLGEHQVALKAVNELRVVEEVSVNPAAAAYCHLMAGQILTYHVGHGEDASEVKALLRAASDYYEQAHEPFYRALALWRLGYTYWRTGESGQDELFRQVLELAEQAGDHFITSAMLHNFANKFWALDGPTEEVESYLGKAAELVMEFGAKASYAHTLAHLLLVPLWRDGDLEKSQPMVEEVLSLGMELNIPRVRATAISYGATYRLLNGEYEQVLAMINEALPLLEEEMWPWCWSTLARGIALFANGDVGGATLDMKRALARLSVIEQPSWLSTFLAYCGIILSEHGEREQAVSLLALGLTDHHGGGLAVDPLINHTRLELEKTLGKETFSTAWDRGKTLDPGSAAEEVLEMLDRLEATGGESSRTRQRKRLRD